MSFSTIFHTEALGQCIANGRLAGSQLDVGEYSCTFFNLLRLFCLITMAATRSLSLKTSIPFPAKNSRFCEKNVNAEKFFTCSVDMESQPVTFSSSRVLCSTKYSR